MLPEHEALLIFTREQFPELNATPCEVEVILKGASTAIFIVSSGRQSGSR